MCCTLFSSFFFLTTVLSQWNFPHGKKIQVALPGESQLPQSHATQTTLAAVHAMCLCFHNPLDSDKDYGIFNMCTDVNACYCTQAQMGTLRECALKVDFGRKIPCCTRESNLCRRHAGPMLYQLSYIPPPPPLWPGKKKFSSCRISRWWMASTASLLDTTHTSVWHLGGKFYCRTANNKGDTVTANL